MFRHFITGINYKKLIEMQAKQNATRISQTQSNVQLTGSKQMVKK